MDSLGEEEALSEVIDLVGGDVREVETASSGLKRMGYYVLISGRRDEERNIDDRLVKERKERRLLPNWWVGAMDGQSAIVLSDLE